MSVNQNQFNNEGLTYDDVLLVPAASDVLPREVSLDTRFTRNIILKTPVVSAAMDTVTESALAIAIAHQGGIGVVHKNMTIQPIRLMKYAKVKRYESGMIIDPVTIGENATVGDALTMMRENKIGGIPVVSGENELKRHCDEQGL